MFYTVLAVVAAYFAWRYRKEILAAWRKFLDELRALWNRLFGRQAQAAQAAAAVPPKPVHKKFAEFADPFASGHAARLTPVELVRYTFEAVEAWGRDHDCPREPQQTPHEFAERLAGRQASLAQDAGILAEMYCRAAYASGTLPAASLQQLRQMWQALRTT